MRFYLALARFHRALAPDLAIALRFDAERLLARSRPPLAAPSRDNACACGFFFGGSIFSASPVVTRRMYDANSFASFGGRLDGMSGSYHAVDHASISV